MRRRILVLAVVLSFLCPLVLQADITYELIDLGTLGGDWSAAQSINDAGQVVGSAVNSDGWRHAALFDPTGSGNNIDLGTLGGSRGEANSINNAGQIVGESLNSNGNSRATLFDPTGADNNIDLGTLGGNYSCAYSINDTGQIVGQAQDSRGWRYATLFDPTGEGNNINLGTLAEGWSCAYSINEAGQVAGWADDGLWDNRAVLFDSTVTNKIIDLGMLGGNVSEACSINSAGQIVGWDGTGNGLRIYGYRAVLFDSAGAGNNVDLGTLGGAEAQARSINDTGQIIGEAEDSQGYWSAALFDPSGAGNNIDLNTLIDPASGWTLRFAYDINNSGWIVGRGWNPQGKVRAFLLVPVDAKYSGGTGEPNDPYQIATAEDLMLLGESPKDYDKHFILTADIDLNLNLPGRKVFGRAVIAQDVNDASPGFDGAPFTGVFDGNGHMISHLTITGDWYLGLFGRLDAGAKISNLGLEAVDVNGTGHYIGGLVGISGSLIDKRAVVTNCYSTGKVTGTEKVGGLVGGSVGGIITCYSTCEVKGEQTVGGLMGSNGFSDLFGGTLVNSYSTGMISADHRVGGLVGANGGLIITSYSTATVNGTGVHVGGLAGDDYGIIIMSCSTGAVTGNRYVGGFAGQSYGQIVASYSAGAVSGNEYVGGFVGDSFFGRITTSFWDIESSGQAASAGGTGLTTAKMQDIETYLTAGWDFVNETGNGICDYWQISPGDYPKLHYPVMPEGLGTAQEPYLIRDVRDLGTVWFNPVAHYSLEASIDLSGMTWAMAVVPWFTGTFDGNKNVISNLRIQGSDYLGLFGQLGSDAKIYDFGLETVDVNGTADVGGLAGCNDGGSLSRCYSSGTVNGTGGRVGGLVGSSSGTVSNCNTAISISGTGWFVGGLVGSNGGNISNCYSIGITSGQGFVGGLVGSNYRDSINKGSSEGSIAASYSAGMVSGNEHVGGLVGGFGGPVYNSFWDVETSGQSLSAGGTGKTIKEMQTKSTFLDAGWDFIDEIENGTEDIWWINEAQDYPKLWWETAEQ
jgi:probable HAF family extracellular repeat protein